MLKKHHRYIGFEFPSACFVVLNKLLMRTSWSHLWKLQGIIGGTARVVRRSSERNRILPSSASQRGRPLWILKENCSKKQTKNLRKFEFAWVCLLIASTGKEQKVPMRRIITRPIKAFPVKNPPAGWVRAYIYVLMSNRLRKEMKRSTRKLAHNECVISWKEGAFCFVIFVNNPPPSPLFFWL